MLFAVVEAACAASASTIAASASVANAALVPYEHILPNGDDDSCSNPAPLDNLPRDCTVARRFRSPDPYFLRPSL